MVEIIEIDTRHRRELILYGFLGIAAPVGGGGNPQTMSKGGGLQRDLVGEGAARSG